jgi:hypothetical protein
MLFFKYAASFSTESMFDLDLIYEIISASWLYSCIGNTSVVIFLPPFSIWIEFPSSSFTLLESSDGSLSEYLLPFNWEGYVENRSLSRGDRVLMVVLSV